MTVSILLRLLPASRSEGRMAGQAEVVETGETAVFADHVEMLSFLRQASGAPDQATATSETGGSEQLESG